MMGSWHEDADWFMFLSLTISHRVERGLSIHKLLRARSFTVCNFPINDYLLLKFESKKKSGTGTNFIHVR